MTTPGQRRTVEDIARPYVNILVRVPRVAHDVCEVCHSVMDPMYSRCWACNEARKVLGSGVADVVSFVTMAPTRGQMSRDLVRYKLQDAGEDERRRRQVGLAAVLWKWLAIHERCMAAQIGTEEFDVLTSVPSSSGREGPHPLEPIVGRIVVGSAARYESLLQTARTDLDKHVFAGDRYSASAAADGRSVLVVDDTWTKGANAQSASAALKVAGASAVGVLAIGRWLNVDYKNAGEWLSEHRAAGWDWDRCCLEP